MAHYMINDINWIAVIFIICIYISLCGPKFWKNLHVGLTIKSSWIDIGCDLKKNLGIFGKLLRDGVRDKDRGFWEWEDNLNCFNTYYWRLPGYPFKNHFLLFLFLHPQRYQKVYHSLLQVDWSFATSSFGIFLFKCVSGILAPLFWFFWARYRLSLSLIALFFFFFLFIFCLYLWVLSLWFKML